MDDKLSQLKQTEIHYYRELTANDARFAPIIIFTKRLIRKLFCFIGVPLVEEINAYHRSLIDVLDQHLSTNIDAHLVTSTANAPIEPSKDVDALLFSDDTDAQTNQLSELDRHKRYYGVVDEESDTPTLLRSSLARRLDLLTYSKWTHEMGFATTPMNRKYWEYIYIAQALFERGMLKPGKRGLGFAVGTELLPALFAKYGVAVTATDLDNDNQQTSTWKEMGAHSDGVLNLEHPEVCDRQTLIENVEFMYVDMNNMPDTLRGFDFCWSNCSFEHLGNQALGKAFILNTLKVLKPGGVSVHTTEFHLGNGETIDDIPYCTIYGTKFFNALWDEITEMGHFVAPLDYRLGDHPDDDYIYQLDQPATPHFKLSIGGHLSTSGGIIIIKKEH